MIKSISISGFKTFKQLNLNDIGNITLFGGKNNTGKTSILESIYLLFSELSPDMFIRQASFRGINSIALNANSMWAPFFYSYDLESEINISAKYGENKHESLNISYNKQYKSPHIQQVRLDQLHGNFKSNNPYNANEALDIKYYKNNKHAGIAHITINGPALNINIEQPKQLTTTATIINSGANNDSNLDAIRFGELDINGEIPDIVNDMKIIEDRLTSLSSVSIGNTSLIYGDIGLGRKIPIRYMGEGTSKLLSIILAIASNKNGIVLIDEIENGIHYSILPKFWDMVFKTSQKYNCQIFATTHSYETLQNIIKASNNISQANFKYIRLDRKNSNIEPKLYTIDMLTSAIEREWEVR